MNARTRPTPSQDLVSLFVPTAGDEERTVRSRIHFARDQAQARAERVSSSESARIYSLAAAIASEWVFRPDATAEQLNEVVAAMSALFLTAARFDRIERVARGRG